MTKIKAVLGLAAVCALAGCVKPRFNYAPNPPIIKSVFFVRDETGLYFPLKAAVEVFDDGTDPEFAFRTEGSPGLRTFAANLARDGSSGWPRLSPNVLSEALAGELAASNLVSSATVVGEDPDQAPFADYIASNEHANMVLAGRILDATLSYSDLTRGRVSLRLELGAFATAPYGQPFGERIWDGTFSRTENLDGRRPAAVMAEALQKLYGQALGSLAQSLAADVPGTDAERALVEPEAGENPADPGI
ncbi:MAG: YajG family lipoprotein [Elusimicrobiota bacterium]